MQQAPQDWTQVADQRGLLLLARVPNLYVRKFAGWAMTETTTQELTLCAPDVSLVGAKPPGASIDCGMSKLESAPRCGIGSIALGGSVRNNASQVFPAQRSRPRGEEQHSSNIERPVSALGSPSRRRSRQEPVKFCE
jgi:hypothetical protein